MWARGVGAVRCCLEEMVLFVTQAPAARGVGCRERVRDRVPPPRRQGTHISPYQNGGRVAHGPGWVRLRLRCCVEEMVLFVARASPGAHRFGSGAASPPPGLRAAGVAVGRAGQVTRTLTRRWTPEDMVVAGSSWIMATLWYRVTFVF